MPRQQTLPFNTWPAQDRCAWTDLIRVGEILDDPGPGAHWSDTTKRNYRQSYAIWLRYCADAGILGSAAPSSRVKPETVAAWVRHLGGSASVTIVQRVEDLRQVIKNVAPEADWSWLAKFVTRLRASARPTRDKRSRLRSSVELFDCGVEMMAEVLATGKADEAGAAKYRDGLCIAFLALRPLRVRNLAAIEIGGQLRVIGEAATLTFEAEEMKGRRPFETSWPVPLTPALEQYLNLHRPVLLGSASTKRLWVGRGGKPLTEAKLTYQIQLWTKRRLGVAITPHLFRDCAATTLATNDPVHVRAASAILGHATPRMVERHYNQAEMLAAVRRHQVVMRQVRSELQGPDGGKVR